MNESTPKQKPAITPATPFKNNPLREDITVIKITITKPWIQFVSATLHGWFK